MLVLADDAALVFDLDQCSILAMGAS